VDVTIKDRNLDDDGWDVFVEYDDDGERRLIASNVGDVTSPASSFLMVPYGTAVEFTLARIEVGQWQGSDEYEVAFEAPEGSPWVAYPGNSALWAYLAYDAYGNPPDTSGLKWKFAAVKVDAIEASSPKADDSPQVFAGHNTDFGDPCAASSPGQALVIFRNAVIDANHQVQDFDVILNAGVLPASVTADQLGESWAKVVGPSSGSLNRTYTFEVKYQNPKVGGLYKFEFDLGFTGCAKSGANVLLPLAGADMTAWLDAETKAIGAWASAQRFETAIANYCPVPGVSMHRTYETWCSISGSFFDYVFDPVDTQQHAPCRRYQPTIGPSAQYGYVTINGVVVHGSKINNMLWSLFGRHWGWSKTSLRLGAHLNQYAQNQRIDGSTSQNAISLGSDIYDNPPASITTVLTPDNLRTLQDPVALIEEHLWPSSNAADAGNSTFTRPTLPTTP
jgi:hypothetical protein